MKDTTTRCTESFRRGGVTLCDLDAWSRVIESLPMIMAPDPYPFNWRTRRAWEEGFRHGLRGYAGNLYLDSAKDYREAFRWGMEEGYLVRAALRADEEVEG